MHKIIGTFILFLGIGLQIQAQTAGDALRYSFLNYGGTARSVSASNSLGALGGDFSASISNPASIAAFRRSELSFTLGVFNPNTASTFENNRVNTSRTRFNINNAAVILARLPEDSNWETTNFAFGINRVADFNRRFRFAGESEGSIADYFLDFAQGYNPDELDQYYEQLAYDTELIFNGGTATNLYSNDFQAGQSVYKLQTVSTKGSMNEMSLSLAGNMNHKFYIGITAGIPILDYSETKIYQEEDQTNTIANFNSMSFTESLSTTGVGFNLKLGVNYRVNQMVRIGGAIHTPTWMSLTDTYANAMEFDITFNGVTSVNEAESPIGSYDYRLNTPWRLVGNAGFIIKKSGFISAEVEWVDYRNANFVFTDEFADPADLAAENAVNDDIDNTLASAVNIRLGGEYVLGDYRVRGGYATQGKPLADGNKLFPYSQVSLGLGYHHGDYFVDFGYTRRMGTAYYIPYQSSSNTPFITNKLNDNTFLLTLGFKFG